MQGVFLRGKHDISSFLPIRTKAKTILTNREKETPIVPLCNNNKITRIIEPIICFQLSTCHFKIYKINKQSEI